MISKNRNNRILKTLLLIGIIFLSGLFFVHSYAATTRIINYQGKLTNTDGTNVNDGTYNFIVKFYDSAGTGSPATGGNCVYSLMGSCGTPTAATITVGNGIFYIPIGDPDYSYNSLGSVDFSVDLWMDITINGDQMYTRKRVTGSPFAFNSSSSWSSLTAPSADLSLGMSTYKTTFTWGTGTGSANLFNIRDTNGNTGTGSLLNITTEGSSQMSPLRIAVGSTSGAGGTEALYIDKNGKIGIGNTSPGAKLEVTSTTSPQFKLSYDTSNYFTAGVGSNGATTFATAGTGGAFTFSNGTTFSSSLTTTAGQSLTINGNLAAFPINTSEFAVSSNVLNLASTISTNHTISGTWTFTGEPVLSGSGQHTRKVVLSPEYAGAVLTKFNGSSTDSTTTGTMISDAETSNTNSLRTYYQWTSSQASLQYYTVAVRVTLPSDFSAWTTNNALQLDYYTTTNTTTGNSFTLTTTLTDATSVYSGSALASGTGATWSTLGINASSLTSWTTPGTTAILYLKMGALSPNVVRIGDISLNYLSKW